MVFLPIPAAVYAEEAEAPASAPQQDIPATGFEIGEHKKEIMVAETVDLSVKVLPSNASEQTVRYWSTDESVATVSSAGQIRGIGKGTATIVLRAGGAERGIDIKVLGAKTESIVLNKDYLVLKPGQRFALKARIAPKDAVQKLTYQSWDKAVATVSKQGVVTGKATGSTFLIVSNGDMTMSVSVIVNRTSAIAGQGVKAQPTAKKRKKGTGGKNNAAVRLVKSIKAAESGLILAQAECPALPPAALRALSSTGKTLTVDAARYSLTIKGSDIVNTENRLDTQVGLAEAEEGVQFELNGGQNLPGCMTLLLKDNAAELRYLYLYNEARGKYERIDAKTASLLTVDAPGRYLLTDEKLGGLRISTGWLAFGGGLAFVCIASFILIRKRHWFW
ncbi:MAG: Ig-like domain-containing protein [Clostridiales Family XIII bacterium]|jgi:hypothetical protein|nr:Ig-like domain-containing protein [Clostridiales Family XIII bacterium]